MIHFLAISPIAIIIITVLVLASLLLSLVALVDIIRSSFKEPNDKLIWVLVVLFLGIFGALLYFILGTQQKVNV